MYRSLLILTACALLAGAPLPTSEQAADAAQVKRTQPKPTRGKVYRVQVRSPLWKAVTVAPNRTVAAAIKRNLNRQGWGVQMRANRVGQVAIRARMLHWHTRGKTGNPAAAASMASILRAQGFQVRIL